MRILEVLERRSLQHGYVIGAGVLGLMVSVPSLLGTVPVPVFVLLAVAVLYFGPLLLIAGVVLWVASTLIFAMTASHYYPGSSESSGWDVLQLLWPLALIILAMGVAVVNVIILRLWISRRALRGSSERTEAEVLNSDQLFGTVMFVLAAATFVALCVTSGFVWIVGQPGPTSGADPDRLLLLRRLGALTWWPGLAIAVTGLVLWIVRVKRGLPIARIAAVDLALLLMLVVLTLLPAFI